MLLYPNIFASGFILFNYRVSMFLTAGNGHINRNFSGNFITNINCRVSNCEYLLASFAKPSEHHFKQRVFWNESANTRMLSKRYFSAYRFAVQLIDIETLQSRLYCKFIISNPQLRYANFWLKIWLRWNGNYVSNVCTTELLVAFLCRILWNRRETIGIQWHRTSDIRLNLKLKFFNIRWTKKVIKNTYFRTTVATVTWGSFFLPAKAVIPLHKV